MNISSVICCLTFSIVRRFPPFMCSFVYVFLISRLSQFKFALNEFNQIQPKKFKESVEFDKILKTIDKLSSF